MGTLKRVDVLGDDLYKEASIDVIRRVCVSGFNSSMTCKSLELEKGPSIDEIENLNGKPQYLDQFPDSKHYIANVSGQNAARNTKFVNLGVK